MITVEQAITDLHAGIEQHNRWADPRFTNALALLRQQSILEQRNVALADANASLREALVLIAQLNPDDGPTACEIAESALAEVPQK